MEARNQALLCQEIESELRELCLECRKKFPVIKDYTERAILKIRHHRDLVEQHQGLEAAPELPEFPLDEVLRAILMACETFQNKIVLLSLSCLQRLIHRRVLKDETIAIVINLMKEQATNGDESVQLKVLQTIMATPSHMTLLNELVVEQLMQLLYVLHNSGSASVHHTACAGLRQLAEYLADRAAVDASKPDQPPELETIRPVIRRSPAVGMPMVAPAQAPSALVGPLRMFFVFVQDLCVMADYDASSLSSRYAVDAGERMRTGSREGFWLAAIKFPRPLCLELLGTCVSAHPAVFAATPECFALLRHNLCTVLLKNLRGCFDFAILIRSIHLLQQIFRCPDLAALLMPELQVFLHLMLDLTTAERSPWQRATCLEFLRSVCEDPAALSVLYEHGGSGSSGGPTPTAAGSPTAPGSQTFLELVNSLSKLIHQVCFSSGMDSGALLHSAAGAGATTASAGAQRAAGFDIGRGLLLGGLSLLGGAGSSGLGGVIGGFGAGGSSGGADGSGAGGQRAPSRVKLLQLMSETEPPVIQPSFLVALVIESVFAIVSTLYRILLEGDSEPAGSAADSEATGQPPTPTASESGQSRASSKPPPAADGLGPGSRSCMPLTGTLSPRQELCRGMLSDCWASLLSALSLLLHGTADEQCLQQALRCLQTLLYCCSRLGLEQARDACLLQLTRYALPGLSRDAEASPSPGAGSHSSSVAAGLTQKNVLCFKALVHFCLCFGGLLGTVGWGIALRALGGLERALQKAGSTQTNELTVLRQGLDSLFETTALLSVDALGDILDAMGQGVRAAADSDEGAILLNRLVEVCASNLGRLLVVWDRVFRIATNVCMSDERSDLRGTAAVALCRILAQALRKGAMAMAEHPEAAQEELLRHLASLLRAPHGDVRARICEGLLQVLQASGQELHPAAWGTMIHLVATAAQVELKRAGLVFTLPKAFGAPQDAGQEAAEVAADGALPQMVQVVPSDGKEKEATSAVLPTVFQLLELLVHDFMEYVPPASVPCLTVSIGAFARFTGLGVNSSLTAVGFLWNVADALARYHCSPPVPPSSAAPPEAGAGATPPPALGAQVEELWVQIFMHLRALAVDTRPEVRNCAVKSLTSALLSHGRKVGTACYRRCLQDILIEVIAEIQEAAQRARSGEGTGMDRQRSENLIVHHSRDTPEKQWDETMVLGVEGVRRVLGHFSEEAGVCAFAPLAYTLLLQVQATLRTLTSEVAGSALRALVDLMRIPASSQLFDVEGTLVGNSALPVPARGSTSIWLLGWSVLWGMVRFCMGREVPEPLMETFASTLSALRNSHRHLFAPVQHMVLVQLALVMVSAPSFYLPSSPPLQLAGGEPKQEPPSGKASLAEAAKACSEVAQGPGAEEDRDVFRFAAASADALWRLEARTEGSQLKTYAKKPAEVGRLVDTNASRNTEIRSMEYALKDVSREGGLNEESIQAFLGTGQSPTFRTMLHVSTARLQHVQNVVFGLLEETHGLPDPSLEVLFVCQCCAVFLDIRRVLRDANKVALAVRALCLLVLFCRRTVLQHLGRLSCPGDGADGAGPGPGAGSTAHLEELLGRAVPHMCKVVAALACSRGCPELRVSGLWRLALEALVYVIEDTLPAVEKCSLRPEMVGAYWEAVISSLAEIVAHALPDSRQASSSTKAEDDPDVLVQAVGNLLTRRLLASGAAPPEVSGRAVRLLEALVGLGTEPLVAASGAGKDGASNAAGRLGPVRHLFDLCAQSDEASGADGDAEEDSKLSVAAMSAKGGGMLRLPARFPDRAALLSIAAPALLSRVRALFTAYAEDELAAKGAGGGGSATSRRAEEVRFVLSRLRTLHVDEAAVAAVQPAASTPAGSAGRARTACGVAGPQAFAMALLPQLAALVTSGDADVRSGVREVLEGLAGELGL